MGVAEDFFNTRSRHWQKQQQKIVTFLAPGGQGRGFPITQNASCLTKPFPPPPKVLISIVFNVSLKECKTQKKLDTIFLHFIWSGEQRGVGKGVFQAIRKW